MFGLVGVTAAGKTALAVRLAERMDLEVVCADAMTIWRGLDVGTAKPSPTLRDRVRHHLLDLFEPGARPSVADVADAARTAIAAAGTRGHGTLVAGGSGLYVRAILDDLTFPPTDPGLRADLEALPPGEALRRLREADPGSLEVVDPANTRRVVRALEITLLTGRPASQQRDAWERRRDVPIVGLDLADEALAARIRARTTRMLEGGWPAECARFDAAGRRDDVLATAAIGYAEVFALLDGTITRADAEERIVRATIRLAKRQRTWFRADPRVTWLDADAADLAAAAERILAPRGAAERHT